MDECWNVRKFADPPWSNVDVSFKCKDMPLAEGPSKRDLGRKRKTPKGSIAQNAGFGITGRAKSKMAP